MESIEPTPDQIRAARALVPWTQAELAGAAGVAVSTVADFERGHRKPVANNGLAMRKALEEKGIRFLSGGAVVAALMPRPAKPEAGRPMRWIEAHDLAQWAGTRDAQAKMPELVGRLLLAAHGPVPMRFPSDESIQHPGWDGFLDAPYETAFSPAGQSGWEIGTQRSDIARKADDDYSKRTANPLGKIQADTTFVFVTPQRWPHKDAWASAKSAEGVWKDVRALDGDDLVHWLEQHPAVSEWLAVRIGRRPPGIRSVEDVWDEWTLAAKPPFSTDLVTVDRDIQMKAVRTWLYGDPDVLSVQAESSAEAIAFLHASLAEYPDNHRKFWATQMVVAASDGVARELLGLATKLFIVLDGGDPGLATKLVAEGHHVYRALGSDVGSSRTALRLPRPWRHSLENELITMGHRQDAARRFANASGRSLTILRRLTPASPASRPAWAQGGVSPSLLAAMLAGAWHEKNPVDRRILETLSGRKYGDVVDDLTGFASDLDAPLRRSGEIWKVASLRDCWFLLADRLAPAHADRLQKCFLEVLGERDPSFDADPDDRWKLDRSAPERASAELRRGLTEAITALGVHPDQASGIPEAALRSEAAVRELLAGADDRLWWSLSRDFRLISEAAPSAFFEAIDNALSAQPSPMAALFRSDEGFLHPSEYLSDLMWAIELHCWDPSRLAEAALLLAKLADMDPGGRVENRPSNSLRRIFLPWAPQTNATEAQRLQVIDLVLKHFPRIGWNLLLALAPAIHGFTNPSATPRWRDYGEDGPEHPSQPRVAAMYDAIGERILLHVGSSPSRWGSLFEPWANFGAAWRASAVAALSASIDAFDAVGAADLRDKLRIHIAKHRRHPDAPWAMGASDLEQLSNVLERLKPRSARDRHAWLFAPGNHHFARGVDWAEAGEKLQAEQQEAAAEILCECEPGDVLDYAAGLSTPMMFGSAVGGSVASDVMKDELLALAVVRADAPLQQFTHGLVVALADARGQEWLTDWFERASAETRPVAEMLALSVAMPANGATWDLVARAGEELEREYWRGFGVYRSLPPADADRAVAKLLSVQRGRAALTLLMGPLEGRAADSKMVLAILRDPSTVRPDVSGGDPNDETMFTFYVEQAFKLLDDANVSEDEMLSLEWTYFQALLHGERGFGTLKRALSSQPAFFVQLLKAVFASTSDIVSEDPAELESARIVASQAFHVLDEWNVVPGTKDDGSIDGKALEAWVNETRRLCAEADRAEIGDSRIGQILSAAPRVEGAAWPPEPVRDVIETCRSKALESGFEIGVYNRRGVTMRLPTDGGEQERSEAAKYRADAAESAFGWPRTRATLERIAEWYERDAKREDLSAEQRDWR